MRFRGEFNTLREEKKFLKVRWENAKKSGFTTSATLLEMEYKIYSRVMCKFTGCVTKLYVDQVELHGVLLRLGITDNDLQAEAQV